MKKRWIFIICIIAVFVLSYIPLKTYLVFNSYKMQSNSMTHSPQRYCMIYDTNSKCTKWSDSYEICGSNMKDMTDFNFDKYWDNCGSWYQERGISKETFLSFPLKDGFSKGDILFVTRVFEPKVGDIVIIEPNSRSLAQNSFPHRIVYLNDSLFGTKGDHNNDQLTSNNNMYGADESKIERQQLTGKVIFSINSYILYLSFFIIALVIGIIISLLISGVFKKE